MTIRTISSHDKRPKQKQASLLALWNHTSYKSKDKRKNGSISRQIVKKEAATAALLCTSTGSCNCNEREEHTAATVKTITPCSSSPQSIASCAPTLSEPWSTSAAIISPPPPLNNNNSSSNSAELLSPPDGRGRVITITSSAALDSQQKLTKVKIRPQPIPQEGLSEYELLRLKNIARNEARLRSLGLLQDDDETRSRCGISLAKSKSKASSTRSKRRRTSAADLTIFLSKPTRRSVRLRSTSATNSPESNVGEDVQLKQQDFELVPIEEEVYTVSTAMQYVMNDDNDSSSTSATSKHAIERAHLFWSSDISLSTTTAGECNDFILEALPNRLTAPSGLGAIYSLNFCKERPRLLVGAGKSGVVALWDLQKSLSDSQHSVVDDATSPILSFKAHSGRWIAAARFLASNGTDGRAPPLLITAANDGSICSWDLGNEVVSKNNSLNSPKLLFRTGKELHRGGIFSMDMMNENNYHECFIASGSKDKLVAVSAVQRLSDGEGPTWTSDFHSAKVSTVKFRGHGSSLLGSTSDDGFIAIHDYRSNGAVSSLENVHFKPHSIEWDPSNGNRFITAGYDDVIRCWDMRNLDRSLMSLTGHLPQSNGRRKKIHHPLFYTPRGGKTNKPFVLSGGSSCLSIYDIAEKSVCTTVCSSTFMRAPLSRGTIPDTRTDVGCITAHGHKIALSMEGGDVILLSPANTKSR